MKFTLSIKPKFVAAWTFNYEVKGFRVRHTLTHMLVLHKHLYPSSTLGINPLKLSLSDAWDFEVHFKP